MAFAGAWVSGLKIMTNLYTLGIFFSIIGAIVLTSSVAKFAVCYVIATLLTIGGSFVLWGPVGQAKKAFDKDRWPASVILIVMIILVLVSAFWWGIAMVTLILCLLQYCAYLWYVICMLPYGKTIFCSCLKNCCKGSG